MKLSRLHRKLTQFVHKNQNKSQLSIIPPGPLILNIFFSWFPSCAARKLILKSSKTRHEGCCRTFIEPFHQYCELTTKTDHFSWLDSRLIESFPNHIEMRKEEKYKNVFQGEAEKLFFFFCYKKFHINYVALLVFLNLSRMEFLAEIVRIIDKLLLFLIRSKQMACEWILWKGMKKDL